MPPRLAYGVVVGGVLAVLLGVVVAAVLGRDGVAVVGVGVLAALACVLLVEQRATTRSAARGVAQVSHRVRDVARRQDVEAGAADVAALTAAVDRLARLEETAAERLASVAATGESTETGLRDAVKMLRHEPLLLQIGSLLQLQQRFAPQAPLVSSGAWSLAPSVVLELVDTVTRERPRLVVECGSGLSTVWLAYALRANGSGRLVSLEHDEVWVEHTRRLLDQHGVGDVVEVRHAPLAPVATGDGEQPWYTADLSDLQGIGVLLVDGPPARTGPAARYPALPVLRSQLAPGAVVVLDDLVRQDEKDVLARWLRDDPTLTLQHKLPGGAAFMRVGAGAAPPPA